MNDSPCRPTLPQSPGNCSLFSVSKCSCKSLHLSSIFRCYRISFSWKKSERISLRASLVNLCKGAKESLRKEWERGPPGLAQRPPVDGIHPEKTPAREGWPQSGQQIDEDSSWGLHMWRDTPVTAGRNVTIGMHVAWTRKAQEQSRILGTCHVATVGTMQTWPEPSLLLGSPWEAWDEVNRWWHFNARGGKEESHQQENAGERHFWFWQC
jgi:hypothetical protein